MEKIRIKVILLFLLMSLGANAQTWVTGITFDYGLNRQSWDSTKLNNIALDFPTQSYDEMFELKLKDLSSLSIFGGFKNHFIIRKNVIVADLSLGMNFYDYTFDLSKKVNSSSLDTSTTLSASSDSVLWENYLKSSNNVNIKGVYPSIRLNLGYKRELFNYRNLVLSADAGILIQRRFSFFQDFNKQVYNSGDTIFAHFGNALNHRMFIPSAYIGFTMRFGSNTLGLRLGNNIGPITRKIASLQIKESFAQITYSKLFRETHLGREQVIYDEYQHLSQTRASEYRKGDKLSYIQFGFAHDVRAKYEIEPRTSTLFMEDADSIVVSTNGVYLQPNAGLDVMLNTFFTHRWMMGLGISMYEESYTSYGTITQGNSTTSFGDKILRSEPDNAYQKYWSKTKASVGINSAVYFSKRTLKVDPYVKGSANMVMNYDVPEFLKTNPEWRSTSFFPYYKLGIGADVRLRLKSSKFFVIGAGVDYNSNPHVNYMQYYLRIGYYRKKKLKNQTY